MSNCFYLAYVSVCIFWLFSSEPAACPEYPDLISKQGCEIAAEVLKFFFPH